MELALYRVSVYTQAGADRTHLKEPWQLEGSSFIQNAQAPKQCGVCFTQKGLGWLPEGTLQPQEEPDPSFSTASARPSVPATVLLLGACRALVQATEAICALHRHSLA